MPIFGIRGLSNVSSGGPSSEKGPSIETFLIDLVFFILLVHQPFYISICTDGN